MLKGRVMKPIKRKRKGKSKESFYRVTSKPVQEDNTVAEYNVSKYVAHRGAGLIYESGYTIVEQGKTLICNCPARISDCRHTIMLRYAKTFIDMSKAEDTFLRFGVDKEPEALSRDDLLEEYEIEE